MITTSLPLKALLPATTALGTISEGGRERGLDRTGQYYRGAYQRQPRDRTFLGGRGTRLQGEDHYATELIWGVAAEIGNKLKSEGIPGRIIMMAYRPYRRVPQFELPDNIDVMVGEAGPWRMVNKERLKAEEDEICSWSKKLGRKIWLWNEE